MSLTQVSKGDAAYQVRSLVSPSSPLPPAEAPPPPLASPQTEHPQASHVPIKLFTISLTLEAILI